VTPAAYPRVALDDGLRHRRGRTLFAAAAAKRSTAQAFSRKVGYDRNYPPNRTDFSPIVRAVQATNPDAVFVASYPLDSVGMVRAASVKLFGGSMVGLHITSVKQQLGPLLNGIVN